MKVLHVCESVLGGTGTYLNELVPLQQSAFGKNNVIFLGPLEHLSQIPDVDPNSTTTYHRPNRRDGLLGLVIAFVRTMRRFQPDLVHAHSTFAGVITRMLCPLFGVPVVYCPHGWAMDMEQSAARRRIVALIERNLSHLCKVIVAVSEYERERGVRIGISANKIARVYNGIRPEPPPFTPVSWTDPRLKVLYVGRLDRQKGIDVLLDAISSLQDKLSIRVIGRAVSGNPTIDFSSYPHVQAFQALLDGAGVASHMSACDVVVMPSRWEGFGLVAVEAMRLSKPVIASMVGGLREIVVDGETGFLFPPGEPDGLRRILLNADVLHLREMGKNGYARFLSNFTADRMCAALTALYENCIRSGSEKQTQKPISSQGEEGSA